jgi:NDP-sugar pyrophosphorylase family protein
MKAMILAAGKGTRMLPLTEHKPKALIEIQGITLLEHTIRYLNYYGVTEVIINMHHHAAQIVDFVKQNQSFGLSISFSDEQDLLLETGGGLYKARHFFNDSQPFVLTSCDVITDLDLRAMLQFHQQQEALVTLAVKQRKSSRDLIFDADYRLCGWHNNNTGETRVIKETASAIRRAFSAVHIINPALFGLITERGRFSIIDVYLRLAGTQKIAGFEHSQSDWFECGKVESLESLNQNPAIAALYHNYHR